MGHEDGDEVIEVDAQRVDDDSRGDRGGASRGTPGREGAAGWGPLVAGVLLDLADFMTPMGLPKPLALLVGAAVGWWAGGSMGLSHRGRLALAGVGAAYCVMPGTSRLPLGTLVGVFGRLGAFGR